MKLCRGHLGTYLRTSCFGVNPVPGVGGCKIGNLCVPSWPQNRNYVRPRRTKPFARFPRKSRHFRPSFLELRAPKSSHSAVQVLMSNFTDSAVQFLKSEFVVNWFYPDFHVFCLAQFFLLLASFSYFMANFEVTQTLFGQATLEHIFSKS